MAFVPEIGIKVAHATSLIGVAWRVWSEP